MHEAATEYALQVAEHLPRQFPAWFQREGHLLHKLRRDETWCFDPDTMHNPMETFSGAWP